jgi:hypothetical protein
MTRGEKKTQAQCETWIKELGWSNVTILTADTGRIFKSQSGDKSKYRMTFTDASGVRYQRLLLNPSLYYALRSELQTEDCRDCDRGIFYRSNYGSTVRTSCPKCGGYYKGNTKRKIS